MSQPPIIITHATSSTGMWSSLTEQVSRNTRYDGPGWTLGNTGGWTVDKDTNIATEFGTRGIGQVLSLTADKNATGDLATIYAYCNSAGGVTALSDEGVTAASLHVSEYAEYFHGVVASSLGAGDTRPQLTFTHGRNKLTDGAFLINLSRGGAGTLAGPSFPLPDTILNQIPTSGGLPVTLAWGKGLGIVAPGTSRDRGVPISYLVVLGKVGSAYPGFIAGRSIMLAGANYGEQVAIQSVSQPTNFGDTTQPGTQRLFINVTCPNDSAIVFQGGLAGQYISLDANLAYSGMRSTYHALGSLDGVNLIYAKYVQGSVQGHAIPQWGDEAATIEAPANGFHLYPGAEIVARWGDGTFQLEPNQVNWQAGDLVENPNSPVFGGIGVWAEKEQHSPTDSNFGSSTIAASCVGSGVTYSYRPCHISNGNPASSYWGYGGPVSPPMGAITLAGAFGSAMHMDTGPSASAKGEGAVISIDRAAIDDSTPFLLFRLMAGGRDGQFPIRYHPDGAGCLEVPTLATGKMTIEQAPLVAQPAPGLLEFDGQDLYFTSGAGRRKFSFI